MAEGPRGIQSIEVSGRILRAIVESGRPMMLKALAEASDLTPAQCHAYLTSLKNTGLVHQDWASGLYSAGPFALRLGVNWINSDTRTSRAVEALRKLTEEFAVMALIVVWGEFGPTIIHTSAGSSQAALNIRQGSRFSVSGTAAGRLFAAYDRNPAVARQLEAELSHKVKAHSLGETLTADTIAARIEEVRRCGYAVASGAPIPGVNAVCVPVFSKDGIAFAACLIGASDRLSVESNSRPIKRMVDMARHLSAPPLPQWQEANEGGA